MSGALEDYAKTITGKKVLAVEAYARALRAIPTIIADNAGYDSAELIQNLRHSIYNNTEEDKFYGLEMTEGTIGDMKELGITVWNIINNE